MVVERLDGCYSNVNWAEPSMAAQGLAGLRCKWRNQETPGNLAEAQTALKALAVTGAAAATMNISQASA